MDTVFQNLSPEFLALYMLSFSGAVFGALNLIWVKTSQPIVWVAIVIRVLSVLLILSVIARTVGLFPFVRIVDLIIVLSSSSISLIIFLWKQKINIFPFRKNILQTASVCVIFLNFLFLGSVVYGAMTICSSGC